MTSDAPSYVLSFACRSASGQVAGFSALLEQQGCYIDELAVFDDARSRRFFVRCVFHPERPDFAPARLADGMARMGGQYQDLQWRLHDRSQRARVLIMVSKLDHCLNDLLYRQKMGDLDMTVVAVVSNHRDLAPIAEAYDLPFHHLPLTPDNKPRQEAALLSLIDDSQAELLVLARYMQVLSSATAARLAGRAINIHHSFLPGFKGARPYQQAHERGVKLIGATAHYITDDLDEGPIIEQVVERVDHAYSPEQLQTVGRDMECQALARAVRSHLEQRVFIVERRTVVLR